jgi:transposase
MLLLSDPIFIHTTPVDMRKSIDGLIILVKLSNQDLCPSNAFVFLNKSLDKIKILIRENNGFVLLYKRLDKGRFKMTFSPKVTLSLTQQQLRWLLDGLDYAKLTSPKTEPFKHYF